MCENSRIAAESPAGFAIMNNMHNKLAIIIPTYNEKGNIEKLVVSLLATVPGAKIIIVDDNSPDGTARVAQRLATENEQVRLIWRESRQGMASAYLDAFARIIPDEETEHVITMDADLSHRPQDLAKILAYAEAFDMVVGSRYVTSGNVRDWAKWRLFISKYGNIYTQMITGLPIVDVTSGFVLYRRDLLLKILAHAQPREPYAYQTEMKYLAHRAGAKIKEVPIVFQERASGKSKLKKNAILEALFFPWYLKFFK